MPLVLPTGELLTGEGLDREGGVFFQIDPSLSKYIPERSDCTPDKVARAYRYLTDEWLVDVAADREGKAVLADLAGNPSATQRLDFHRQSRKGD